MTRWVKRLVKAVMRGPHLVLWAAGVPLAILGPHGGWIAVAMVWAVYWLMKETQGEVDLDVARPPACGTDDVDD